MYEFVNTKMKYLSIAFLMVNFPVSINDVEALTELFKKISSSIEADGKISKVLLLALCIGILVYLFDYDYVYSLFAGRIQISDVQQ